MSTHEYRCSVCLDGLARTLWMNANGNVPGYSGFWANLPWSERWHWIAEADRIAGEGE